MKAPGKKHIGVEVGLLLGLLIALIVSGVITTRNITVRNERLNTGSWMFSENERGVEPINLTSLEGAVKTVGNPVQSSNALRGLFVSELRVVAIGSAYPIPYEAEVCPFSTIPQPEMNQLDQDNDGITDDWELKFGLDKYNVSDALLDLDEDGFTNLEEFQAGSDPTDLELHPPYATKLRFIAKKNIPFPLVFRGISKLSDGSTIFQLNTPADGNTHFAAIGEKVEGVLLKQFIPHNEDEVSQLFVVRGSTEIKLIRGKVTDDPESKVELINILDRSRIIATMGTLLSLRNDEYIVLSVYPDKVVVRHLGTGEVFDIIGLAEGEH